MYWNIFTYRTLRNGICATASALLLIACSLVDEDNDDCTKAGEQPGSAIAFTVSDDGDSTALTRTAPNTLTLDGSGTNELKLQDEGFGVFASHTGFHPYVSSTTTSNLMWNQKVAYDNSRSQWDYTPTAYWPYTEDGLDEYVTFFAYAPYSDGSTDDHAACIVDFSLPGETGDPWLVYQLGGTMYADGADGWKARQVDLLYDFQKDQKKPDTPAGVVSFSFKHALACVGDRITVTCSDALQTQLKNLSNISGSAVTLTLNTLRLDYELTQKGKLILNGKTQPNWQTVNSGDVLVHRLLVLNPDHILATATSVSACTLTDYTATDQGVFYIPIQVGTNTQKLTATAYYTLSTGDDGAIATTINLDSVTDSGTGRNLNLSLSLP